VVYRVRVRGKVRVRVKGKGCLSAFSARGYKNYTRYLVGLRKLYYE